MTFAVEWALKTNYLSICRILVCFRRSMSVRNVYSENMRLLEYRRLVHVHSLIHSYHLPCVAFKFNSLLVLESCKELRLCRVFTYFALPFSLFFYLIVTGARHIAVSFIVCACLSVCVLAAYCGKFYRACACQCVCVCLSVCVCVCVYL